MPGERIDAIDVHREFDGGAVQALRGVTLQVSAGEFVAIAGPSGCGKSTLLNLLGGLDEPTRGAVRVGDADLRSLGDLSAFRARTIGFIFQAFHLLPTLSALENVQMPMFEMPWTAGERRRRAVRLLEAVGLGHRLHHRPGHLSAGERQRVAIARSLANEPSVLLADEPTGNLDSQNSRQILDLIRSIHAERGTTLAMVTHDPEIAGRADRIVRMLDGRMIAP